jgi:hypothetical protein
MKSHRTDSVSLFFGLAFLMIAIGYLAKVYLKLDLPSMGWFIAAGLIFLGIVGAITALVPSRKDDPQPPIEQQEEQQEVDADADAEQAR